MADPKGFLKYDRVTAPDRPVSERIKDWQEFHLLLDPEEHLKQAARCMDCGVPFCHSGCPLGNLIPEWNDLVFRGRWQEAIERLHATNNFPEFTGRLCPAPCEGSCVLGINCPPVNIKLNEQTIIDVAWREGWVKPEPPLVRTGKTVAIVGSGPAGLCAAQQLARAGHSVTVFERADRIGGLLRYGIPDFKLEKWQIDRRIAQMEAEGVVFRTGVNVGVDLSGEQLLADFDAVVLTGGSTIPRDLKVPGRELKGVHFAMEFLTQQNRRVASLPLRPGEEPIDAKDKHVIIIGGGDTGADCLGTSIRQGAASVTQLELLPKPPLERAPNNPWPQWPLVLRSSSSHEEGGQREWCVSTTSLEGTDGQVCRLHAVRVEWEGTPPRMREIPGSEFTLKADLVLLAMGFLHPQHEGLLSQLGVQLNQRGNVQVNGSFQTNIPKVFAAGDMRRGQSLVVWAMAEGREAARHVDTFLMGASDLPLTGARRW